MNFYHRKNYVKLEGVATDSNPTAYEGTYKVVVVEGKRGNRMRNTEVDWDNYESVAKYYGFSY